MKKPVRLLLCGLLVLLIPCLTAVGVLYARRTIRPRLPSAQEVVNAWVWDGEHRLALSQLPDGGEELLALMEEELVLTFADWGQTQGSFFLPYYEICVNWQGGSLRLAFQAEEGAVYTPPTAWLDGHTYRAAGVEALTAYLDRTWLR